MLICYIIIVLHTIENRVNGSYIFHLYHLKCISKNGESHHISCTKPTKGTMMGDGKHDSMHFFDTGRMSCQ